MTLSPLRDAASSLGRSFYAFVAGDLETGRRSLGFQLLAALQHRQAQAEYDRNCRSYVGITGSCGKSTTTMLTAEVLRASGEVKAGVFWGDERGVLRTLRKLEGPTDYVVQEISGHFPGAIRRALGGRTLDVAVVTAVGLDHLTTYRRPENVAAEKANLVAAVRPEGLVCLNADNPFVRSMQAASRARVVSFGRAADAEVRAENITASWPERLSFDLVAGASRYRVETRFVGTTMLPNVLAALSVAFGLGKDMKAAIDRLSHFEPRSRRQSVVTGRDRHAYVLDTFKASLWSTRLVVEDLSQLGAARKIFVLGSMSDTGNDGNRKVRQVLKAAAKNCELVIGMDRTEIVARQLAAKGHSGILAAGSPSELAQILAAQPASLVVLKGNKARNLDAAVPAAPSDTAA
jgi:UDP-N-acetylmuramoyl-tripeptide--D-alanyl-D-alanine ligase